MIDGPEKFDPRIRLFPYESQKLVPYHEFRRWVAPPPNPPPMTVDERMTAARRRREDPPLCHCGVRATLVVPPRGGSPGGRLKYSPFFRCSIKTMDGWPVCQFNEYVQGPRSVWPSDGEVRAYEAGQAPWPCTKYPEKRCKCGILAERGVVPSELGYGWYCGNENAFWEGRTCDWEWFSGRDELVARFRCLGQRDKERETRELRDKIRNKYDVPLPDDELLAHDTLIKYWRLNRILYPRPLSRDERAEKRRKLEEERHLERQVQDRAREAQLEAMSALVGDLPCNMTIRKGALERSSNGFVGIRDAQRDVVRAPGSILRKEKDKGKSTGLRVTFALVDPAVNKGKGVVVISSDEDDGWGDDEILSGCESD
ncbi:hypothetical protein HU200_011913 [Digitaria exilis]|uniref:Uncharacterized protein n=1 Tax=Digitaria exilis TaxID=1010633 RepID=A0A835FFI1_9POAL|nr:hypothetical protein HU200_011913 [Digitaria exilis]